MNKHWRQGDVLVRKVERMPTDVTEAPRENGRVILAHGEVTGHAHAIREDVAALFATTDGRRFLQLSGPASITHEEHTAIPLDAGTYEVIRQREYHPEEIRNVAD